MELTELGQDMDLGLERICFAPIIYPGEVPTLDQCTVQSIFGYYGHDFVKFNESRIDANGFERNYLNTIISCTQNAYAPECFAPFGGPVEPGVALGGMPKPEGNEQPDYNLATAVTITFIVNNHADPDHLDLAMQWEELFINFLKNYESDIMEIAFSAERSIQDGIQELSEAEMSTVIISYAVMFVYIMIALGKISGIRTFLLESKITLAVGGIVIVLVSVACSLGIFGYAGVSTTMLTIEVIPFLVLAIGVDNIFIMVHTYNRLDRREYPSIPEGIGMAVGQVGPSILLTASAEIFCFGIGALSNMPAVHTFAMYAAVALLIDFILQLTAFVALMSLDQRRYESKRFDLMCCFRMKEYQKADKPSQSFLQRIIDKFYAPFVLSKRIRPLIFIIFILTTCLSIMVAPHLEPGLDQELSMAKDSHVVNLWRILLSIGPPVYFVVTSGLDYSLTESQNIICGGPLCNNDSVSVKLYMASQFPEITHLARPSSSWIDDYFDWISVDTCCKLHANGSFCPSTAPFGVCQDCEKEIVDLRPTRETFMQYFSNFLSDLPHEGCAKAGRAAYVSAINYIYDQHGDTYIQDFYFNSYHTTLSTSRDFYTALKQARIISDDIQKQFDEKELGITIFPYSVFYVFYEQYLTIWEDSLFSLGMSMLCIFGITFLVTGFDIVSALTVFLVVLMILINMLGLMWAWSITLNAVSLVNLVVIVTDPVELWANPDSRSRIEKDFFDSRFGAFYRTEQLFLKPYNTTHIFHETELGVVEFGPAFNRDFLLEVFRLQMELTELGQDMDLGLERICFAPIIYPGEVPTLDQCTVQSIFGYYGHDFVKFNESRIDANGFERNYLNTIISCTQNAYAPECFAPFGGPVEPGVALGGMPKPEGNEQPDYNLATAVTITFIVNNHADPDHLDLAMQWEELFINFLKNYESDFMEIAFSAERSIQDGIQELSEAEMSTVIISYAVMFVYIMIALGKISGIRTFLLESKITLAVGGIVIVLVSVACSLGIFGYAGVSTTMLTIEVIPFLVLAIGVDNIFIMVHTYNRLDRREYPSIPEGIGMAVGQVGPSILLTASAEIFCFGIGALSNMPAVHTFAMYAAVALLIDFILQLTAFVALMSLDQRRYESKRFDLMCCFRMKEYQKADKPSQSFLQRIIDKFYAPFVLSNVFVR
uniref:SSD domain-containing protein n=2 Tax=Lutzomyia longipalpis TaxID=7200 RepID=A0A1B0CLS9_LUTLO